MFGKKRPDVSVIAVVSDTHPNSQVGLCPPDGVRRDFGGHYMPNKGQLWLWSKWEEYWAKVRETVKRLGATCYVVFVGDGTDDNTHSRHGLITVNESIIVGLGVACMQPAVEVADYLFYIRGTEAHTGGSGELEELVARELKAEKDTVTDRHSWWWLPLEVNQVLMDLAHHPGSNSMRPWTKGGGANRQAAIIVYDRAESGDKIPQLAFRGHVHHLEDSGWNHPVRVLFLPPWQLRTSFEHRIGFSGRLEKVGAFIVTCKDGESEVKPVLFGAKRRKAWRKTD